MDVPALLVAVRRASGLSQRALADRACTSGATVAAYESGTKEPRLTTLVRLVESAGYRVRLDVEPLDAAGGNRAARRSLALHGRVLGHLLDDPEGVVSHARKNLVIMRAASPDSGPWLDEWEELLEGPTHEVAAVLLGTDEHSQALRQSSPFAGILSQDERFRALRAAR